MSKKNLYVIITMLIVSNGYFIFSTYTWQNEWFEQFVTTFDVETMFKENELCKVTYDGLLQSDYAHKYQKTTPHDEAIRMAKSMSVALTKVSFEEVEANPMHLDMQALKRGETLFYFNKGAYLGSSKAELLSGGPWLLQLFVN